MSLLLFFIDGIGIAPDESKNNGIAGLFSGLMGPHSLTDLKPGRPLFFERGGAAAVDAVMGVKGKPQSATGQTTIFTGINAPAFLGYHLTALPNQKLVDLIKKKSLMKKLKDLGVSATSANMYSKEFFAKRQSSTRNLFPVSTLTIKASGAKFRMYEDYLEDKAVFADLTNTILRERGIDIQIISPEKAASNMINILNEFDFVFFEYFMTDIYGHKRNKQKLTGAVNDLNRFFSALLDSGDHDVLVVSDHGNAEDLSSGDHTENLVPAILFCSSNDKVKIFFEGLDSLKQIYERVILYLNA